MARLIYRILVFLIRLFSRKMKVEWEEPFIDEPCIFAVNHAGAAGPIIMETMFPLRNRCHPWVNSPVLDKKQMPEYVRIDHWWNENSIWAPLLSRILPPLAAAVVPPLLREAHGIPVYRDQRIMSTLRESVKIMKSGDHLIIFPQEVTGHEEYSNRLHTGWLTVCELYHRSTGSEPRIYPVYIDQKNHLFRISAPVQLDPKVPLGEQQDSICEKILKGLQPLIKN